jgi:hypothetical protein
MNRRQRRAAAAQARKRPSYITRVLAAAKACPLPAGLSEGFILHADACTFHSDGTCCCTPEISIHRPDGDILVVDEDGVATKVRPS